MLGTPAPLLDTNLQVSTKCEKCNIRFFKLESLQNHQRLHLGERFTCSLCNKSISSKYHLTIHMQTHANQKYPCSYIGTHCSYPMDFGIQSI